MRAPKTKSMQANIQASIAVRPSALREKKKVKQKLLVDWQAHLGGVGGDGVEDVDEDKEEGDKEGHPARDDVHRNQEGNPGDNHKQSCTNYWIWKQMLPKSPSMLNSQICSGLGHT